MRGSESSRAVYTVCFRIHLNLVGPPIEGNYLSSTRINVWKTLPIIIKVLMEPD